MRLLNWNESEGIHNIEIVIKYSKNANEYSSSYGEKSGFGKYICTQGEEYKGEYLNDKRHGKGKFKWPDGRSYRGDWVNDKSHG